MTINNPGFGALLKEYRDRKGWTLREFAKYVPFSYSHLGRFETGDRNPPDREGVIELAKALDADVDALLLAASYAPTEAALHPISELQRRYPEVKGMRGVEIPMGKMPYAGEVGCGRQLVLHPEEDLDLPQEAITKGDFSVKACGDSMNKARIDDGDILIVKRQDWAEDGQIVIANLEWDGATCKRYRVTQDGPYLVPESYSLGWEPIKVDRDVTILGVVKAIHRPLIDLG